MTALQYSTPIDHSTDPGFRAWALELSTYLQSAGLVKTADTGQINFVTVSKPSANTAAGYEIYTLNDSLAGTRPVYIKLEYGSGSTNIIPQIWITTGSGSNGAGALTGYLTTRKTSLFHGSLLSTVTNYTTSICVTDGFVGVAFKLGASSVNNNNAGFFAVCRSCSDSGVVTGDWLSVYTTPTSSTAAIQQQTMDYIGNQLYSITDSSYSTVVGNVASSLVGMDIQVYKHFAITPRVRPVFQLFTVITNEGGTYNTFTTASVGSVSHNYISLGGNVTRVSVNSQTTSSLAMLWE